MKKKQIGRIATAAGIAVIGGAVILTVFLQAESFKNSDFRRAFEDIVIDTNALTQEYQREEGKWLRKQYDNSTMISVVDNYRPRYLELIDKAQSLETPDRYRAAQGFLVKSLQYEMEGNDHLLAYLVSGDPAEYEKSSELLSRSLAAGAEADAAIKAAG